MRELAASRVRFGYRRLTVMLRREGWAVNAKRIYRLYTEDGLAVRTKVRKKIARRSRVPALRATRPNEKWSMDFVAARLLDGRWFRVLTVVDQFGRSGRRRAASRNQGNWVAAIAGAMTWLRVSSSGGIGDAASVSVNAMGRRPGRGRRRSRNSSNTTSDEWPGSKGLGPFRLWLGLGARLYETGNTSPFKLSK